MYSVDLSGKSALIFGVANQRSIAWAIAQVLHQAGARLALTYQNQRLRDSVAGLAATLREPQGSALRPAQGSALRQAQGSALRPFDKPFDPAQDRPFGPPQGKLRAQGRGPSRAASTEAHREPQGRTTQHEGSGQALGEVPLLECDVSDDGQIAATFEEVGRLFGGLSIVVHSIAYANREDLGGEFSKTGREGFRVALEVSAFSLLPIARYAAPLMEREGGSIVTLTFQAAERVFPGYNVMGVAKAALQNEVRQLAAELGSRNIRVNAISAGPLDTLSSRVIRGYHDMKRIHAERAPLQRNVTHEEVARAALYLCSDLASGVTGVVLPVDAGYHIMGI